MAPPSSNQFPSQPETQQQMHETIESIWHMVCANRQTIEDAREAIADRCLLGDFRKEARISLARNRNHRGQLKH